MRASALSGGRSRSQHSQLGRRSSIAAPLRRVRAVAGVVEHVGAELGRDALAEHLDGSGSAGREVVRQVGGREHATDREAVGGAAHAPDDLAVARARPRRRRRARTRPCRRAACAGALRAARPLRLARPRPTKSPLRSSATQKPSPASSGVSPGGEVAAEGAVALLHAQRVEHAVADRADAVRAPGGGEAVPDLHPPRRLGVELVSELAHVGDRAAPSTAAPPIASSRPGRTGALRRRRRRRSRPPGRRARAAPRSRSRTYASLSSRRSTCASPSRRAAEPAEVGVDRARARDDAEALARRAA